MKNIKQNKETSPTWTSRFVLSCNLNDAIEQLQNELNKLDYIDLPVDFSDFDDTVDSISLIIGTLTHLIGKLPQDKRMMLEKRIYNMISPYPLVRVLFYFRSRSIKNKYFNNIHTLTVSEFKTIKNSSSFKEIMTGFLGLNITKDKSISLLYQLLCVVRDLETSYSSTISEGVIGMEKNEMIVLRNIYKCIHSISPPNFDMGEYLATTFYENDDVYDIDLRYLFDQLPEDDVEDEELIYGSLVAGVVNVLYNPDRAKTTIDDSVKKILETYRQYDPNPDVDEITAEASSYITTALWRAIDYTLYNYAFNAYEIINHDDHQPHDIFKQVKTLSLLIRIFIFIVETKGGAL